jgi:hypothetical protein
MVQTLQTGADDLVLADTNQDSASLLALSSQAVLRLFQ